MQPTSRARRPRLPALRVIVALVVLGALAAAALFEVTQAGARREPGSQTVFYGSDDDLYERTALDTPYDRKLAVTDVGNIRLVVSNTGTFGTGFQDREKPSMEWPARSGLDHLVRGAVWIAGVNSATGDTLVTTGGRDAYYLEPIFQHTEFTPVQGPPQEYSRLRTSPFFRPGTVSDEHFYTVYVDTIPVVKATGSGEERHRPMGLRVIQNTYSWGFDPLDDFVIVELNIVNVGDVVLQDLWVGIYSELVTNNRNGYANWPPGGVWFDRQDPHYESDPRMLRNNRKGSPQYGYGAIKLLGTGGFGPYGRGPDSVSTKEISLPIWSWSPGQFLNWRDVDLYALMSTGSTYWPPEDGIPDPDNTEVNPVTVFSVGPFRLLAPGDTMQAVFAFMAGDDRTDLERNAFWAQKAYDDAYALPSPPSSPVLRVFPQHQEITLRWSQDPEREPDPASKEIDFQGYRVFVSETPEIKGFKLAKQFDIRDGVGFDTGLDAIRRSTPYITEEGDSLWYEFALQGVPTGFKRYVSVVSYDFQEGDPPTLVSGINQNNTYVIAGPSRAEVGSREVSVFPNPYRGESAFDGHNVDGSINPRKRVLWFVNLPQRASIRIYTLAGDLVRQYEFDAATYVGQGTNGILPDRADIAVGRNLVSSGTMAGFDLLNSDTQEIASGLYMFSVRDLDTGETSQGKFMVIR